MLAYLNGQFLPGEELHISPDDRGFLFADGLYEVIRSYGGKLFRLQEHLDRLSFGAKALRFNTTDFGYLQEVAARLIQENDLARGGALVYIQVTRGVAPRKHEFPPQETPLTVYASAKLFASKHEEQQNGVKVILRPDLRWTRTDIKSVSLLPNVLAHQEAVERKAAEAIFVRGGFLTEGTASNVFLVIGSTVITPPKSPHILSGITRQVVLELCSTLSLPVCERPLLASEISHADELFITSTTVEVTPVVQVDAMRMGDGHPGPLVRRLQEAFRQEVARG